MLSAVFVFVRKALTPLERIESLKGYGERC